MSQPTAADFEDAVKAHAATTGGLMVGDIFPFGELTIRVAEYAHPGRFKFEVVPVGGPVSVVEETNQP